MDDRFREQRTGGERIYSGRIVTLEVDTVRRPDGSETVREVVRHPGASVVLPLLDDGRVVLVRQFRYPVDEILLELPAGKLDPGEAPEECARRELLEETGWEAGELVPLGSFYTAPGFTDELLHAFVANELERAPQATADAGEFLEVVVLTRDELRAHVERCQIRDAKTLTTLQLAEAHGWEGFRLKVEG